MSLTAVLVSAAVIISASGTQATRSNSGTRVGFTLDAFVPRLPVNALALNKSNATSLNTLGAIKALRGGSLFGSSKSQEDDQKGTSDKPPQLLTVAGLHDSDVAAVYMNPKRGRELHLQNGMAVEIKGRRRRSTAGVCIFDNTLGVGGVSVHPRLMKHLKLVEGDIVVVQALDNMVPARRLYVQAFKDNIPTSILTGGREKADHSESILQLHMAVENFFRGKARPLRVGDQFLIPLTHDSYGDKSSSKSTNKPTDVYVEVKVMQIDGDNAQDQEFGLVTKGTEVMLSSETLDRGMLYFIFT